MTIKLLEAGLTPKMRPLGAKKQRLVCVLDVGSSKICALIARLKPMEPSALLPHRTLLKF
jgi:cell division protein FtsA